MAFRTGVNLVMHALTGNYKADQVHVPALLERARAQEAAMNNWSIDFAPLLPVPFFVAAVNRRAFACWPFAVAARARRHAACPRHCRHAGCSRQPDIAPEELDSLANIALVVIDESTSSQTLANRPEQAQAIRTELDKKLGAIKNLEVKWVSVARPVDGVASGTQLFAESNRALANTPPDRLAGVVMITDGQVHDARQHIGVGLQRSRPCPADRRA